MCPSLVITFLQIVNDVTSFIEFCFKILAQFFEWCYTKVRLHKTTQTTSNVNYYVDTFYISPTTFCSFSKNVFHEQMNALYFSVTKIPYHTTYSYLPIHPIILTIPNIPAIPIIPYHTIYPYPPIHQIILTNNNHRLKSDLFALLRDKIETKEEKIMLQDQSAGLK